MGYTHYWEFKKPAKGQAKQAEALYQKAIKDCQRVVKAYRNEFKGSNESLSGYSAHCKLGEYGGLNFNGKGRFAHEDFYAREHLSQNEGFNLCKTARKPYDVVVTACLAILKFHLRDLIDVSSDGTRSEWTDGVDLANEVLRRTKNKIDNPIPFDAERDLELVG